MKRPISESYLLILAVCLSPIVRCQYQTYGENVALYQSASQSSTYNESGFMFVASLGVDGNISTNFSRDKTCSHTNTGHKSAWWTVDLSGFFFIKFIRIYQLMKQNIYNRLDGSMMYVRVEDSTWQHIQFNSNWPPELFDVNVNLDKRINSIKLNNTKLTGNNEDSFISICELQAYEVIECSNYSIGNGSIKVVQYGDSNQTFTYGTKLNVTCHEGYKMSDYGMVANETESNLECNANGNWSRNLSCTATDCGWPPNITNNSKQTLIPGIAGNTTYNATLTVECNEGYNYSLQDKGYLRCANDGLWAGKLGNCNVIDCGRPLNIPGNSTLLFSMGLAGNTSYNATLTVRCNNGFNYTLPGNETIRCGNEGRWPDILGLCKAIQCGLRPTSPSNSVLITSPGIDGDTSYNATMTVVCNEGYSYTYPGSETSRCRYDGVWEAIVGNCNAIECLIIFNIDNGEIKVKATGVDGKNNTYGVKLSLECDSGFTSNVLEITCLDSGLSSQPVCITDFKPTDLIATIVGSVVTCITAVTLVVGIFIFIRRRKTHKDDATRTFNEIDESKVGGNSNPAEMNFKKGFKEKKRNSIPDDTTIAHKVVDSGQRREVKEEMSAYECVEDFDMENFKNRSIGLDNNAIEPYDTLQLDKRAKSEYDELNFERESSLETTMKGEPYQNMRQGN